MLPAGIEPASRASEARVLSIGLREQGIGGGTFALRARVLFDLIRLRSLDIEKPFNSHSQAKQFACFRHCASLVPEVGLEPTPLAGHDFESCAAAITPLRLG